MRLFFCVLALALLAGSMDSLSWGVFPKVNAQSFSAQSFSADSPWPRHVIDDRYRGADGVRLADFNSDGTLDIVTGWEESGVVCLYLNPGAKNSRKEWPSVVVGRESSPEDAVPCDLDQDGRLDIVSCHEGKAKCVLVHWNNSAAEDSAMPSSLVRTESWKTEQIEALKPAQWMYAMPGMYETPASAAEISRHDERVSLILGSKNANASITLLQVPPLAGRDTSLYHSTKIRNAGWIMSLEAVDIDGDRDLDLVFTDRKGVRRGAGWLERPDDPSTPWQEHFVTGADHEVMFLSASEQKWIIATRDSIALECVRESSHWKINAIEYPPGIQRGKSIDYLPNGCIVMTANTAAQSQKDHPGIWLRNEAHQWTPIDTTTRVKFDRFELVDLDNDGDLDVITCEERRNLGVVWYENPGVGSEK